MRCWWECAQRAPQLKACATPGNVDVFVQIGQPNERPPLRMKDEYRLMRKIAYRCYKQRHRRAWHCWPGAVVIKFFRAYQSALCGPESRFPVYTHSTLFLCIEFLLWHSFFLSAEAAYIKVSGVSYIRQPDQNLLFIPYVDGEE